VRLHEWSLACSARNVLVLECMCLDVEAHAYVPPVAAATCGCNLSTDQRTVSVTDDYDWFDQRYLSIATSFQHWAAQLLPAQRTFLCCLAQTESDPARFEFLRLLGCFGDCEDI
jgi:hypothetical protein